MVEVLAEPEDESEDCWHLTRPTPAPRLFSTDYLVVNLRVNEALDSILPDTPRDDCFGAMLFCVARRSMRWVVIDDMKRHVSHMLWERCGAWVGSKQMKVYYPQAKAVRLNDPHVQIPYDWSMDDVEREFGGGYGQRLPWTLPVFELPAVQPPIIYAATAGTEMIFLYLKVVL